MKTFKIGGIEYNWECKFSGAGGSSVDITKTMVRGMTLEENIFEPFFRGSITFMDPANIMDSLVLTRGDGAEKLTIQFSPVEDSSNPVKLKFVLNGEIPNPSLLDRMNTLKTFELLDAN